MSAIARPMKPGEITATDRVLEGIRTQRPPADSPLRSKGKIIRAHRIKPPHVAPQLLRSPKEAGAYFRTSEITTAHVVNWRGVRPILRHNAEPRRRAAPAHIPMPTRTRGPVMPSPPPISARATTILGVMLAAEATDDPLHTPNNGQPPKTDGLPRAFPTGNRLTRPMGKAARPCACTNSCAKAAASPSLFSQ